MRRLVGRLTLDDLRFIRAQTLKSLESVDVEIAAELKRLQAKKSKMAKLLASEREPLVSIARARLQKIRGQEGGESLMAKKKKPCK